LQLFQAESLIVEWERLMMSYLDPLMASFFWQRVSKRICGVIRAFTPLRFRVTARAAVGILLFEYLFASAVPAQTIPRLVFSAWRQPDHG
jgi:hypothetical protein